MTWTKVKVVGDTLTLLDGRVLSRGPLGWEAPTPPGTSGPYEVTARDGSFVTYNPPGGGPVVFPFRPTLPNEAGVAAIAMDHPE